MTSAYTAFPNNPLTDSMPEVWHIVDFNGKQLAVMAADPMDAIDKVRSNGAAAIPVDQWRPIYDPQGLARI